MSGSLAIHSSIRALGVTATGVSPFSGRPTATCMSASGAALASASISRAAAAAWAGARPSARSSQWIATSSPGTTRSRS